MSIADQIGEALNTDSGRDVNRSSLTLAKVTNINDDQKLNRVKCLPLGGENTEETDWCYVMAPMGGKECGLCLFPQVGDLVVLAYLGDDPHRPLVLGSFWNSEQPPPYPIAEGKAEKFGLKTPKKIELLLCDTQDKQCVTLTMPSGTVVTVSDEQGLVEVKDKQGENALSMNLKEGTISLKAKQKLELAAGQVTITLDAGGDLTLKAGKGVQAEGATVAVKASGELSLEGANAAVKANGNLDLNASGMATVKGSMLKLN